MRWPWSRWTRLLRTPCCKNCANWWRFRKSALSNFKQTALAALVRRAARNAHGEIYRNLFWRIASMIVAGLVLELSVHCVRSGAGFGRGNHRELYVDVAGINAELLRGIKRETQELPSGILHLGNHHVIRDREGHRRGDQFRRRRLVGVHVKSRQDMDRELCRRHAACTDGDGRNGINRNASLCRAALRTGR